MARKSRIITEETKVKLKLRHAEKRAPILELVASGIIVCVKCKNKKSISDFQKDNSRPTGHRARCKECLSPQSAKQMKNYVAKHGKEWRWKRMQYQFGITKEEYFEILAKQLGVCAICKKSSSKHLRVDHNHETKKVRGLLCGQCNSAIGLLGDNITACRNAAIYLEERGSYGKT